MPETNKQEDFNVTQTDPKKVCKTPGSSRQQHSKNYDGREPFEHTGHEAAAHFWAIPKSDREFETIIALAEHFAVTRMTVHRWMREPTVLRRADWISIQNKVIGKLCVRQEWPAIMEKMTELAKAGNIHAAKLCQNSAWTKDLLSEESLFDERAFRTAMPKLG